MLVRGELFRRRSVFRTVLAAALAVGMAGACRRAAPAPAPPDSLRVGTAIPKIGENESGSRALINSLVFDRLIGSTTDGQIQPKILDKWEWRENNRALYIHVRPNVVFHDGTALTAPVIADILRLQLIQRRTENMVISTVASVDLLDDQSFIVRTEEPEGLLLTDIAAIDLKKPGNDRIGTGAYRLTDNPLVLQRFDNYYLGIPAIAQVRMEDYGSQRAAWTALMRGDIDMLHEVSRDAVDFVKQESTVQTRSFLRAYYDAITFNLRHPVLGRREVRQALNAAVNRNELVKTAMRRQGMPANDPIWPQHWAYPASLSPDLYSPDTATTLLDSAGLTVGREQPEGRMPSRFHFKCLILDNDSRFERSALVVQRQLADIGVDMEVVPITARQMGAALKLGNFDAAMMEFVGSRSLNWNYLFWHSPWLSEDAGFLRTGYSAADEALDNFRHAIDADDIRTAVDQMQHVFREDPPALFLAWMERSRAVTAAFNVPGEGEGDILGSLWKWQPSTEQARTATLADSGGGR